MQIVFIDSFIVPEESKVEFLEGAKNVQKYIRTLPGFIEGYIHEQMGAESQYNFLTTAVWENEDAFENARRSVALENQRQGIDPQETAKRLKIERLRSTYVRSPY